MGPTTEVASSEDTIIIDGRNLGQQLKNIAIPDNISHLEIENFEGGILDLRDYIKENSNLKIIKEITATNSLKLSEVHIPEGIRVSTPPPDNLEIIDTKKVSVFSYDENGQYKKSTALGRPYSAAYNGQTRKENLNLQAYLGNSSQKEAACRQLSIAYLMQRQLYANKNGTENKAVDMLQEIFGDTEKITANVTLEHDELFTKAFFLEKENHIVGHSQLGNFAAGQYSDMRKNGDTVRSALLITGLHVMAATFMLKNNNITGQEEYVMTLFDPNNTLTHVRTVADDLSSTKNEHDLSKVKNWKMQNFLPKESVDLYYGDANSKDHEKVSRFIIIPNDLYETRSKRYEKPEERIVNFFLSDEEAENPACFHHLLNSCLPLNKLADQINNTQIPISFKKEILAARDSEGTSGLSHIVLEHDMKTFKEFVKIVGELEPEDEDMLEDEEIIELMANTAPGLLAAYQGGGNEIIRSYYETLQDAMFSPEVITKSLALRDSNGTPGPLLALENGHKNFTSLLSQIVRKESLNFNHVAQLLIPENFNDTDELKKRQEIAIKGIVDIVKTANLRSEKLIEFLTARNEEDAPPLWQAMQEGNTSSIKSFCKILKEQKQEGSLTDDQIIDLLIAENEEGISALSNALAEGKAESIQCFGELLDELGLTPQQIAKVVTANADGITHGLHTALERGHAGAIKELGEIIKKAELEPEELANFLAAKDIDGTHGLWMASSEGKFEAVEEYLNILVQADLSADLKANLLRGSEEEEYPAFQQALFNGREKVMIKFSEAISRLNLKPAQVYSSLTAFDEDNKPNIKDIIEHANQGETKAFGAIVLKKLDEGKLTLAQATDLTSSISKKIMSNIRKEISDPQKNTKATVREQSTERRKSLSYH